MKFLGWTLLLFSSAVIAQQKIDSVPLSVEDDGARAIVTRKEGDTELKNVEKAEVVIPPAATELAPPNDEVVNPPTQKGQKKKSNAKTKVAKNKVPVKESSEALTTAPLAPAPVAETSPAPTPVANPADGQLKLEPKKADASVEAKKEEGSQTIAAQDKAEENSVLVPIAIWEKEPRKYIQLAFGYINSRYEKVHKTLDNGSTQLAFKFISDLNSHVQTGFAIEALSDTSSQKIPDNIRLLQYRLFGEYHAPLTHFMKVRMDWVAGGAFSIGEYGIKRRYLNANNEEVSVKIKNGTIVGLIPTAGIRFYLVGPYSLDVMAEYHQYFGNPQKYIGGLGVSPRLNFPF